jgi:hypothetical protein
MAMFSGGRGVGNSVLNISPPGYQTYPFKNFLKSAGAFRNASGTYAYQFNFNVNNYPISSPPSQNLICNPSAPSTTQYSGSYYIAWTGNFGTVTGSSGGYATGTPGVWLNCGVGTTIQQGQNSFVTSPSGAGGVNLIGTDGMVELTPPAGGTGSAIGQLIFLAGANISNISNIAICRSDQVSSMASCLTLTGTQIFNPDYITWLKKINPKILRFLLWSGTYNNSCNHSRFQYDPPVDCMTYVNPYYPPSAAAGDSTSLGGGPNVIYSTDGVSYVGVATSDTPNTLTDGELFIGKIGITNTSATPTLDVHGPGGASRGAKAIKYLDLQASNLSVGSLALNSIYTFSYDLKMDCWLYFGGGLATSVPLSVQAQLCNAVNCDGWFHIPALYDVASAVSFGNVLSNTMNSDLKTYVEYSNEFEYTGAQHNWGIGEGAAIGFPNPNFQSKSDMMAYKFRSLIGQISANWPAAASTLMPSMGIFIAASSYTDFRDWTMKGPELTLDLNGYYTLGASSASTTGSISGTTLTVSSGTGIQAGQLVTGTGVATNTRILSGSGTSWTVNNSQTVSSTTLSFSSNAIATNWTISPNRPLDFMKAYHSGNYFEGPNLPGLPGAPTSYITLQAAKTISGITTVNPGVITATAHGYSNGDRVKLSSITGTTQLNGVYGTVANKTTDTFQLTNVVRAVYETSTITITNPGIVTTSSALANGDMIVFSTSGALPIGITAGTTYFVVNQSGSTCQFATTANGTAINTTGSQSGIHTVTTVYTSDFSALTSYISGGSATRVVPGVNAGLVTAADDYAAGNTVKALQWMLNDVISGTRDDGTGAQTNGISLNQYSAVIYPSLTSTFGSLGLPFIVYEAAYDAIAMTATQAIQLGLDYGAIGSNAYGLPSSAFYLNSTASSKISNLLSGFKNSDYFRNAVCLYLNNLKYGLGNTAIPGWFLDIGNSNSLYSPIWSLATGDLYTYSSFQSLVALENFNS